MFRLVSCLVFIILRAQANVREPENPEIHLSYDKNEVYTVWKDKPLKIIIEISNTRHAWCSNKYSSSADLSSTFVPNTEFTNGNNIQILNITNVTAEMSTRWLCTVLQEYHGPVLYEYLYYNYTATNIHFNLHVKGAKAVIVLANQENLTFVTTNLSVNYDGEANYTYEDGEDFPMNFSCKQAKDEHNEDTLRLEYYNAEGMLLFQTKPRIQQPHIFRSVLKSNNDKYYLDCIRAATNPEREYRYRTTFFKRNLHGDAVQHAVILFVNGQKLTSLSYDDSYDDYIFRYIDGELLTVTCQKMDVNMKGSLSLYAESSMSYTLRSFNPSEAVISVIIPASHIKDRSLTCSINNTNAKKPNARLLFVSDVTARDVRIRGLPRNNILYQYTNDVDQWTIEYQYSANDTLNLTCVWNKGFQPSVWLSRYANSFQWKFEDQVIVSDAITTPDTPIMYSNTTFTTILNEAHNGTKIKCTYFPNGKDCSDRKTVEIILRLKPELVSEAKREEDTSGVRSDDDNLEAMTVPIAVGVGVAITIITMICLVSWRKRTKRANLIENAYDNLSNQNDSQIPAFPSQWEDNCENPNYAKTDEEVMRENYNYSTDNDKLYRMSCKRQSNTSENHYTEIDDYFKPKSDGLAANWNTAQSCNYNKQTNTPKAIASHSSNNTCYNNFNDPKQGTYDKLSHNNLPINNSNENYSNVQKPSKSVTFRQMSNDFRSGRNYSEGNSGQDVNNTDREVKLNNDGYYGNMGQDMHTKPNYENIFLQNEKTGNPLDSNYAEPYEELGITCKNNFYG